MKATNCEKFSATVLSVAVQGALLAMFAVPQAALADEKPNEEVIALTHPSNTVEIGAEYVPQDSAKFGEYNGLNKKGTYLIGNFNVRGGDAYDSQSGGDGTRRWEIKGSDLGTTSREIGGNASDQGKWSLGIDFDTLRHNITDTYQTPFQGAMGGNNFTLPSNFGVINTTAKPTGYSTAPGSNVLTAAQQAAFNTPDVYSQRDNSSFNAKYIFDSQWDVKFDFNHLVQSGAKLMGVAGDQVNGVTTATVSPAGQTPLVLMSPTNYTTDSFNLALNWVGDKGYASTSYFGSLFRDGYNSVSFDNPFQKTAAGIAGTTANLQDVMSTMPSNDFHQLNINGGYNYTSATKLVGGLSYSRNTQDDAYAQQGLTPSGFPQNSLGGLVVSTHADMKLSNQTSKDLLLSAALKYNQRDNQTASNAYKFNDINEVAASTNTSTNTPMSNNKTQFELAGDYRLDKNQKLRMSYEYEEIKRWCNNALANNAQGSLNAAVTGVAAYTAATCAQVPDSRDGKLALNYKLKATEDISLSAGYGYSNRQADISSSFYNPMQAVNTPVATGTTGQGFEAPGFMAYFQSSRKEQQLKAGVNWQANDKLALGLNARYTDDKYDSIYGVQNGNSWSLNLDATYNYAENSSFSAYATSQNMSRDMTNLQGVAATAASATALNVPVGGTWTNTLKENDTTFGLGTQQGGFMGGKLDLTGDLTYSLGKSGYATQFNYSGANLAGNTCSSAFYLTCGSLPDISSELLQLKFSGIYKIDKVSKVKLGYMFQRLLSSDYFYNAYQYGSTPATLLPTNQQAPSYSVNVVSATYMYSF